MSNKIKRIMAIVVAVEFIFMGALTSISELDRAYADVGSINAGEDITYDKDGGVLASMGFDTSKMPEDYDPDATTNPYGSDVSTMKEVDEALFFYMNPSEQLYTELYGHNKKLNGSYSEFKDAPVTRNLSVNS